MKKDSVKKALRLLCVHQGAELYGSDRSFLQVVEGFRHSWPDAHIKVVLAADGPLSALLEKSANEVVVRDLCVLRLAKPVSTILKLSIGMPYYLIRSLVDIYNSDFTYINTTVIADYMFAASFCAKKSVIHVREIPKRKAMPVVRGLVAFSRAALIYNSKATGLAFAFPENRRQAVVYNGVSSVSDAEVQDQVPFFGENRPLRLVMLGRISDWKGQDLLVEALSKLRDEDRARVQLRIVGSTFRDNPAPIKSLQQSIDANGLSEVVTIEPFSDDPAQLYRWADICVVPSRLPEPFGRVAIEAMAQARPVIAAAHGGLMEIVEDGITGWLFTPNDIGALCRAIENALADPGLVRAYGSASRERFLKYFSADSMISKIENTIKSWMPGLRTH